MDPLILGFILTAVGWGSREFWRRRQAKRQAASDAGKILNQKKALLEELISKTGDSKSKQSLTEQLDEVHAALLGLHAKRLRHVLEDAGLPSEETLIANGRRRLKAQQVARIQEVVADVKALPSLLSIRDLFVLGNAYYHTEQYQDAIKTYDQILNLHSDDPEALNNRGVAYAKLERYDEALADFNRALELEPDYPEALSNRGITYANLERYDEALTDYNRALELKPDYLEALYNRGLTYSKLERCDEALADYNRALRLKPDSFEALCNRGFIYAEFKRYDEALADYNRALELQPDDPTILYNLACLFSLWGKPKESIAYLKKAIALDSKCREDAKTDTDFDNIKDAPRFKKLIELD